MESKKENFQKNALLAFASAILLALTLPYLNWWWFVWVALVPFLIVIRRASSLSSALLLTTIFGATYGIAVVAPLFQLTTTWWSGDVTVANNSLIVILLVVVTALYGALFFFPITYLIRKFRRSNLRDVLFVAMLWACIEYIRSQYALIGYGWGTIGYTLVDATFIKENAAIIGVYGLSFLIITVNMFVVLVIERLPQKTLSALRRTLREFIVTPNERYVTLILIVVWLSAMGYGVWKNVMISTHFATPVHVGMVVAEIGNEQESGILYQSYREKIIELLSNHPETNIVLLPENVFPFFQLDELSKKLSLEQFVPLQERDALYEDFISLSQKYPLTTFAVGLHTTTQKQSHNTLVFYQNGEIIDMLYKQRLVPFFEYAPLGLPIPLFESHAKGNPGQKISILGNTLGMLMCSEISDGSIVSPEVNLVLSPSNDGVFASSIAGRFHDVFARMRAIESGAYLVRANKGSVSSIISPTGDVLKTGYGNTVLFQTLY